ncbi:MAG: YIP1 family protein [Gammaproteobacteria bacterium]
MFQNLIDILTAPSAAFTRLKEKPTILFPLLLVLLTSASVQVGYVLLVDRGFMADQQIEQVEAMFPNVTDAQLEQMRENVLNTSTTTLIVSAMVNVALILFVILALYALYLKFASKFSFADFGWKAWMSMVCWTSVPLVFSALASWIVLLTNANGQVPMQDLNALSFANLLGLEADSGPLFYLSPLYLWCFVLLALGYQHWTKKSFVASALIALGPYILIFGLWGLL